MPHLGKWPFGFVTEEKAMRLNAHFPSWYLADLGQALYLAGRFEEAVVTYEPNAGV